MVPTNALCEIITCYVGSEKLSRDCYVPPKFNLYLDFVSYLNHNSGTVFVAISPCRFVWFYYEPQDYLRLLACFKRYDAYYSMIDKSKNMVRKCDNYNALETYIRENNLEIIKRKE